jgi:hypothetical protein
MQKRRVSRIQAVTLAVLFLAAAAVLGLFSVANACDVSAVEEASLFLQRQMERFDHSYQFATSATPDRIVRPVAELQQILMDTQQVEVPGCLQTAKEELIGYMGMVIRAFLAYGAQEPQAAIRELVGQSDRHYESFHVELEEVRACAPWCFR